MRLHCGQAAATALAAALGASVAAAGCTDAASTSAASSGAASAQQTERTRCDPGNGGITLPNGLCATVFADNLGHARHLAIAPNGDVYVNTWSNQYTKMRNAPGGYLVALRDADGDGHAELVQRFGAVHQDGKSGGGTGVAVHRGYLYAEVPGSIVRYVLDPNQFVPAGEPETVVSGLPLDGDHPMHPFAITPAGVLFVNSGSASNACQEKNRAPESRGQKPCPELATRAGIWEYQADKAGQVFSPRERFATGARNSVGLAIHPADGALFVAIHGRDQLSGNWPKLYTDEQNNELPAEILVRLDRGEDFGWPYCYYDGQQGKHVLAPEYGGDGGKAQGDCAQKARPDVTFPAHWAPEAVVFTSGSALLEKYRQGAFVSFHGSWNRKPTQGGFLVTFVPFANGNPTGSYEEFATGFTGVASVEDPKQQARHRPMGLAIDRDGALYVSDDVNGRVWRIAAARPTT